MYTLCIYRGFEVKKKMFGNDDPFDSLVREFFGENRQRGFSNNRDDEWIQGEEEDRNIDLIQTNDYVYAIFELPGYKKEEVSVNIQGNELIIKAKAVATESQEEYISEKLSNGIILTKLFPKFVSSKGFKTTFRNGVLEICFKKK